MAIKHNNLTEMLVNGSEKGSKFLSEIRSGFSTLPMTEEEKKDSNLVPVGIDSCNERYSIVPSEIRVEVKSNVRQNGKDVVLAKIAKFLESEGYQVEVTSYQHPDQVLEQAEACRNEPNTFHAGLGAPATTKDEWFKSHKIHLITA